MAAEDLNFEMSEGRRPRLSQRPCEVSVGRVAREQIDSLMDPFSLSSALPSSKVAAFSNKDSLGDEMLAAALLKAKSQVSCGSPYPSFLSHFMDPFGAAPSHSGP